MYLILSDDVDDYKSWFKEYSESVSWFNVVLSRFYYLYFYIWLQKI